MVFEEKNFGQKIFSDPGRRKKNFSGRPPGSRGGPGGPKWVKIVPLGLLTIAKRSGTLQNLTKKYKYYIKTPRLAQDMPETPTPAVSGRIWVSGPWAREGLKTGQIGPKNQPWGVLGLSFYAPDLYIRTWQHC